MNLFQIHQTLSLLQNLWPEGADIRSIVCSISCAVTLRLYKRILCDTPDSENLNTGTDKDKTQVGFFQYRIKSFNTTLSIYNSAYAL